MLKPFQTECRNLPLNVLPSPRGMGQRVLSKQPSTDRLIMIGDGCASIPEKLLLAHSQGQVLFITGAGTSMASGLPDFRDLVDQTYATADASLHSVLKGLTVGEVVPKGKLTSFNAQQRAEAARYARGDWDVVLGMLERRIDGVAGDQSTIRQTIARLLRTSAKPASMHKSLIRLSDRGSAHTIITTNFDLLLEDAARSIGTSIHSYALGAIPRPSRRSEFGGIFHIHGVLDRRAGRLSDFIITDQDFGELYLRRRTVADFIYDAARLYHLVLVGYSANDAPMRYLLNAVAADGSRFDDLKERFTFVSGPTTPDDSVLEDWKGRGITPIPYDQVDGHKSLSVTLEKWASLSAINGKAAKVDSLIKGIVKTKRSDATDQVRDLFDHIYRRGNSVERTRIAAMATKAKAEFGWLNAMADIGREPK